VIAQGQPDRLHSSWFGYTYSEEIGNGRSLCSPAIFVFQFVFQPARECSMLNADTIRFVTLTTGKQATYERIQIFLSSLRSTFEMR
jgi:hypothetical protein